MTGRQEQSMSQAVPGESAAVPGQSAAVPGGSGAVPGSGWPRRGRDQGTPARHRGKLMLAAAAAAGAGAGAAAALLAASGGHPPALATVTRALASTAALSYRFTLDSAVSFRGRQMNSDVVSGSCDPRGGAGTELLTAATSRGALVRVQIRFTGGYVYTQQAPGSGFGKPWNKSPVPPAAAAMPAQDIYGFVTDEPVSPAELSRVLRSAAVRQAGSAAGPGWTGTRYVFTARFPAARESVTGTIDIDQQGRVRRLVTITTQGRYGRLTTDTDLTFSNFGAPVPVTAPPASQIGYTSTPYSGYFF
jgi:hypothetical protein